MSSTLAACLSLGVQLRSSPCSSADATGSSSYALVRPHIHKATANEYHAWRSYYSISMDALTAGCIDPGHGESSRFRSGPVTPALLAADAAALVLARDLYARPLVVVGAGVGAAAALQLAADAPALVGALALVDPDLDAPPFFPGQAAAFAGALACLRVRAGQSSEPNACSLIASAVSAALAMPRSRSWATAALPQLAH